MYFEIKLLGKFLQLSCARSHGVMVSTLDFESSDPSSNLGGTWWEYICYSNSLCSFWYPKHRKYFLLFQLLIHRATFNWLSYLDQYQTNFLTFRPLIQSQTQIKPKLIIYKSKVIALLLSTFHFWRHHLSTKIGIIYTQRLQEEKIYPMMPRSEWSAWWSLRYAQKCSKNWVRNSELSTPW